MVRIGVDRSELSKTDTLEEDAVEVQPAQMLAEEEGVTLAQLERVIRHLYHDEHPPSAEACGSPTGKRPSSRFWWWP